MSSMFVMDGAPGTAYQRERYSRYFAGIAERTSDGASCRKSTASGISAPSRYTLRPDVGEGTVEVLETASHLRVVRYDVQFHRPHYLGYEFPADRFEVEICVGGSMGISERVAGEGELTQGNVSVAPTRRTQGAVCFPAGTRYRAVSVSGSYSALDPYLGSVGHEHFRTSLRTSDRGYLGAVPQRPGLVKLSSDLYTGFGNITRPGFTDVSAVLGFEALITASLAHLVAEPYRDSDDRGVDYADFEGNAVRRVPDMLWSRRHDLPTVRELAGLMSMSPKRLAAVHRSIFGVTVMEHHRRRCADHACRLLTTTTWTVEHIAHDCGYASASYFIYAFRRRLGCTPGEYRQDCR